MPDMQRKLSLEGKNVLVTGATGYLGRAMVLGLSELGARAFVNGRDRSTVSRLVEELRAADLVAEPAVFDINNEAAVQAWFEEIGDMPLHGLVNNAYAGGAGSIETSSDTEFRNSYEIALVSANRLLREALPSLRTAVSETGAASVVNIGSMYGMVSPDHRIYPGKHAVNPPFYGAAKAALIQWTRYAACEFGAEGIRVNAVSPGPFPSSSVQASNPEFVETLAGKVPMGRIGQADELQGPLSFLISDASSFVNGANLVVDGGWTCW